MGTPEEGRLGAEAPMAGAASDRLVFSPGDRRDAVIDVIRSARTRLLLSLFRCNDFKVLDELAAAAARGVQVEALITQRAKGGKRRLRRLGLQFGAMGATVWYYDDPLIKYHAKYLVSDAGVALVGTFNLTRKCFKKTCDFGVVTCDPAVVGGLEALFHADCRRQPIHGTPPSRLVIAPETARERLSSLVARAQRHIRLIDRKIDDPGLVALLTERQREGVRVDVVTGTRVGGLKLHGKMLVIDDEVAIVSSMSLSAAGLGYRREVAIEIHEPAQVHELIDFFHGIAGVDPLPLVAPAGEDAVL